MHRFIPVALTIILLSGFAAAQTTDLDRGPGMIAPDSPLYGLETAFDNAAVSIGLKSAGGVAQERAAEARKMAEKGDYNAAEKAIRQMSTVAQQARSEDTEGLEKAESVLQELRADAPEEAQQGLQAALDNVRSVRERAQQLRERAGQLADRSTRGESDE